MDRFARFPWLQTGEDRSHSLIFSRFVATPENRSALTAVQHVAACLASEHSRRAMNPLFLHGPAGTGKTHLITALVEEVTRQAPQRVVTVLQATDLGSRTQIQEAADAADANPPDELDAARDSDLLIVEDLQHLPVRGAQAGLQEAFVRQFDERLARQQQMVFTANAGPGHLEQLAPRLVSRLGSGLVVSLEPLQMSSRLALLLDRAQRRQLAVSREVLAWLAENLPGGIRQLLGTLVQLDTLTRFQSGPLDVKTVADHFQPLVEATQPTVERIAERVSRYFRLEPRQLQSKHRYQSVLLPRQVGMYLSRRLTNSSLADIGRYFGGRDHSTVLHACQKIEGALKTDMYVSGVVRQLQAELA